MALASLGTIGASQNKTSATSITHTYTAGVAANSFVLLIIAKDNSSTVDAANTSEVTTITDSAGNTYSKYYEYAAGSPGASASSTVSVWGAKLATAATTTTVITANFDAAVIAKAISGWAFSVGAGNIVSINGVNGSRGSGTNLNINATATDSTAANSAITLRAQATEAATINAQTCTGFTAITNIATSGSGAASNQLVHGFFQITQHTAGTGYGGTVSGTTTPADTSVATVLLQETTPPASIGRIKVRLASSWDEKPVKVWDGASWVEKPLKYWNGSAWVLA